MHRFTIFSLAMTFMCTANALNTTEYLAKVIEPNGQVSLLTHEKSLQGLSCASGQVGVIDNLHEVSIGDQITVGKYTFRVGIIEVIEYHEDFAGMKKGDVECVLAPNKESLPYKDDCNAIWLRVPSCTPIKRLNAN